MPALTSPPMMPGPFAETGDKVDIIKGSSEPGRANMAAGVPPITQKKPSQGGIAPKREDFNGILYLLSQFAYWQQSGGMFDWSEKLDYVPPALVHKDGVFYRPVQNSGPSYGGAKAVTSTTYWRRIDAAALADAAEAMAKAAQALIAAADAANKATAAQITADAAKGTAQAAQTTANTATSVAQAAKNTADAAATSAAQNATDIAAVDNALNTHANNKTAGVHGAATGATANTIAMRGTGGTLNVGTPTAAAHAATKDYVDAADSAVLDVAKAAAGAAESAALTAAWTGITGKPPTYPPSAHMHGNATITDIDASKILSGTIDIARLPAGALERLKIVTTDAARYALTTADVQTGDTVQVTATKIMYRVVDDSKLSTAAGYVEYTAARASAVPWSGVEGKPSDFVPAKHAATHKTGGGDALAPADIGAAAISHTTPVATASATGHVKPGTGMSVDAAGALAVKYGTAAGTACQGNDSRLTNARTPTAHAATHKTGGGDAIAPADIGAVKVAGDAMTGNLAMNNNSLIQFANSTTNPKINLYSTAYAMGIQSGTFYLRTGGVFRFYKGGAHQAAAGPGDNGTEILTLGSESAVFNGSVTATGATVSGNIISRNAEGTSQSYMNSVNMETPYINLKNKLGTGMQSPFIRFQPRRPDGTLQNTGTYILAAADYSDAEAGTASDSALMIRSGGTLYVGSGESATNLRGAIGGPAASPDWWEALWGTKIMDYSEAAFFCSDQYLYFVSAANDIANSKMMRFGMDGSLQPGQSSAQNIGGAAYRWNNVFTVNGVNTSSDANLKTNIHDVPQAYLDAWRDVGMRVFQMIHAVEEKGEDAARLHIGPIAQHIVKAFSDRGIDAFRLGLVGKDEEEIDGETIDRLSIRADECLFLACESLGQRLAKIEEHLGWE